MPDLRRERGHRVIKEVSVIAATARGELAACNAREAGCKREAGRAQSLEIDELPDLRRERG